MANEVIWRFPGDPEPVRKIVEEKEKMYWGIVPAVTGGAGVMNAGHGGGGAAQTHSPTFDERMAYSQAMIDRVNMQAQSNRQLQQYVQAYATTPFHAVHATGHVTSTQPGRYLDPRVIYGGNRYD